MYERYVQGGPTWGTSPHGTVKGTGGGVYILSPDIYRLIYG